MKTDNLFFQFFQRYPAAAFKVLGLYDLPPANYEFKSLSVKEQAFNIDGVYVPLKRNLPLIFLEVYFYKDKFAYRKIVTEALLYLRQSEKKQDMRMVLIFESKKNDPRDDMLSVLTQTPYLRVIYLDELATALPNDPYFSIIRLLNKKQKFKDDLNLLETAKENLIETDPEFFELLLITFIDKHKKLSREEYFRMYFDPTKPFHVKESVMVQEYAQEVAQELTQKHKLELERQSQQLRSELLSFKAREAKKLKVNEGFTIEKLAKHFETTFDEIRAWLEYADQTEQLKS